MRASLLKEKMAEERPWQILNQKLFTKNQDEILLNLSELVANLEEPKDWEAELKVLPVLLKCRVELCKDYFADCSDKMKKATFELRLCQIVNEFNQQYHFVWISDINMLPEKKIQERLAQLGLDPNNKVFMELGKRIILSYLQNFLNDELFMRSETAFGIRNSCLLAIESVAFQESFGTHLISQYCSDKNIK